MLKTAIPLLGLLVVVAKLSRAEETAQMPWDSRRQTNGTLSATASPTNCAGCDASQQSRLQQAFKDAALLASKGVNFDINLMALMEFFGAPVYVQGGNHMIIQILPPANNRQLRASSDISAMMGRPTPERRSLAKAVEYAMPDRHRRYDLRSYDRNQGSTLLHQILHISAVGQPSITDIMETTYEGREYGPAIEPLRCKYLAYANERNNVAETIRNADNYVQFAMAMATNTEQNTVAEGGENRTNEDAPGMDRNVVPAGSTAIPAEWKQGLPPKNTTSTVGSSTTQKGKSGTNGKKGKAANPGKKKKKNTPGNCRRTRCGGFGQRSGRYFQ
ncbi:hypothetical protein B0H13DRAFT_1867604 [Mycena leptocephala]|nr:hypothetical protein B0H13DRAFT_1867604 [Mycena leptocephala]